MVERKRISVLLPAYKAEKTLSSAISSTLRALGPNDELLVLIQGAGDYTAVTSEKIDQRLQVFFQEKAQGIVPALNYLASKATGDYLARMDADDICLKRRFNTQLRFLEKFKHDLVFSNSIIFGQNVRPFGFLPQPPYALRKSESKLMLTLNNPFVHPTMLAKRTVLEKLGFYRPSIAEDYDLWLRAAKNGYSLGRSRGFAILYRIHSGQLSQNPSFESQVANDKFLAESHSELLQHLIHEGELKSRVDFERQIMAKLKRGNLVIRLIWSPWGSLIRRLGNKLLGKRNK